MAITLNKRFAVQCEMTAIANGRITPHSSPRCLMYDISRAWRALREAGKERGRGQWSEREEAAAEVVISAVTYLQHIGCSDIERLLTDTLERQARQNG